MRLIQFLRKQIGKNVTQNISIGLQLPPNNPGSNVDTGDVVEVPKSCLGLAEDNSASLRSANGPTFLGLVKLYFRS